MAVYTANATAVFMLAPALACRIAAPAVFPTTLLAEATQGLAQVQEQDAHQGQ